MNKESITQFSTTCITITLLFFAFDIFSDVITFEFKHIFPYFFSSMIGAGSGLIYFKFFGFKFSKYQFLSCVIASLIFTFIIIKSGLHHYWLLHDLTITVSFMLIVFNLLERRVNSLKE